MNNMMAIEIGQGIVFFKFLPSKTKYAKGEGPDKEPSEMGYQNLAEFYLGKILTLSYARLLP